MDQKLDNTSVTRLIQSPIGTLELKHHNQSVQSLLFLNQRPQSVFESERDHFGEYVQGQIDSYFVGKLRKFDIRLKQDGTDFQQKVWMALATIPYGHKISYSSLAQNIGDELLTRAVANANSKNKILILIPCHRVVGKDGKLTGYSAGIERKRWLLNHENHEMNNKLLLF